MSDVEFETGTSAENAGPPMRGLDEDSALSRLMELEMEEDAPAEKPAEEARQGDLRDNLVPEGDEEELEDGTKAGADDADPSAEEGEQEEEGDEEGAEEAESHALDIDSLKGDTKLRLRDGSEFTVSWVKQNIDNLRNVHNAQQQLGSRVQQLQQAETEYQTRATQFQKTAGLAVEVLKASIPEIPDMPDENLLMSDPWEYNTLKHKRDAIIEKRNAIVGKLQGIEAEQRRMAEEQQDRQKKEVEQARQWHSQQLGMRFPELKSREQVSDFMTKVRDYCVSPEIGFAPEELGTIHHHGFFTLAEKARRFDELMSKPAPKPVKETTSKASPTAPKPGKPGQRKTKEQANAQSRENLRQRIHKKGGLSEHEAAALLLRLEE